MTSSCLTFFRSFDPGSDIQLNFCKRSGEYEISYAAGLAVLASYEDKDVAVARLKIAKRESRSLPRILNHNWWRLISWLERCVAWPRADLDDIIL